MPIHPLRLGIFTALLLAPLVHGGETTRVSVSSAGDEGNGWSVQPSLSRTGRFVAFTSLASNLVAADTNGTIDVFVHDRKTGTTSRVSVSTGGVQASSSSDAPSISGTGRFVAFVSGAADLVPGDMNGRTDVFVHDRKTVTTSRVSVSSGAVEGNDDSSLPKISANGRFVAFRSEASNLVADDTNETLDVFVHDRKTRKTSRVSISSAGAEADYTSGSPSISANGRIVAFSSFATTLVPGDDNPSQDVFAHDRKTGKTTILSISPAGLLGNSASLNPSISASGRLVTFTSSADNLVPDDTNRMADIFVADRKTGKIRLVSVASDGSQAEQHCLYPEMSGNGRFVAFQSNATNLVADDDNAVSDCFVRDLKAGTTTRASVSTDGTETNAEVSWIAISGNGRFVGFSSFAANLVPDDGNLSDDIFVHDRK